jgi:hypothetical protein
VSSLRQAEYLSAEVPGVTVPQALLERLGAAGSPEVEREVGLTAAQELLRAIAPKIDGVLIAGPLGRDHAAELVTGFAGTRTARTHEYPGKPGIRGGAASTLPDPGQGA